MAFEKAPRFGVHEQAPAKGVGHALGGDVVMGGADPTGRKDIIEAMPHLVDRGYDNVVVVRYDPAFAQPDAGFVEPLCKKSHVRILGAAGQDLVPDHEDADAHDPGSTTA